MDASHPSRSLSRIGTALCAAVVLFAGAATVAGAQTVAADQNLPLAPGAVVAQASPSPAPPAGGTATPRTPNNPQPSNSGGQSTTPARPLPPLSHLPIIDFVVTFTQPGFYTNAVQLPAYDPIDIGGTVRIPITRKFNLLFDRITEGTINQPLERSGVYNPAFPAPAPGTPCTVAHCVFTSSKDTRDIILQYHGTYAFNRFLTLDVGDSFRHRVFASGSGTNFALNTGISAVPFPYTISSTEHHFAYGGLSYTTRPWKELLNSTFVFSETVDAQNVDHHVGIACTAAMITNSLNQCAGRLAGQVGYLDEHPGQQVYYETTQGVSAIIPVDPKHGTSFLINDRWGYLNFYENAVTPYRWDAAMTYQLSKRFSPGFTLAMRHSDYHASATQSAPFISPNAIHVGSWDLIGTFHVDTNTFFH
jgi:hypothetical protein